MARLKLRELLLPEVVSTVDLDSANKAQRVNKARAVAGRAWVVGAGGGQDAGKMRRVSKARADRVAQVFRAGGRLQAAGGWTVGRRGFQLGRLLRQARRRTLRSTSRQRSVCNPFTIIPPPPPPPPLPPLPSSDQELGCEPPPLPSGNVPRGQAAVQRCGLPACARQGWARRSRGGAVRAALAAADTCCHAAATASALFPVLPCWPCPVLLTPATEAVKAAVAGWGERQLQELEAEERLAFACEKAPTDDPIISKVRARAWMAVPAGCALLVCARRPPSFPHSAKVLRCFNVLAAFPSLPCWHVPACLAVCPCLHRRLCFHPHNAFRSAMPSSRSRRSTRR